MTVFIDGACEPRNPGGYGACAMVVFEGCVSGKQDVLRDDPLKEHAQIIGSGPGMTNNIAEWRALRGAMHWLVNFVPDAEIHAFMDSKLVVNQFHGQWQCKAENLIPFHGECTALEDFMPGFTLRWVPRDLNWVADELINELYAEKGIKVAARHQRRPV